jgi:GntR family transcriptional regulator, rspAB operon transcriptional repressor
MSANRVHAMGKETATFQQQTYDYVRDQIINLGLKPGEFVNDAQIAEKLNISRTPVREAFQRLEKEGLLVNEARKGWRVYMLDLEDIHDIFELKIAIEGMLVRKAAQCADKALRRDLADALAEMKAAVDDADPDAWLQSDIHLHNILFLMANNERAEQIVRNLNDQWHRIRLGYAALQGRTGKSVGEHEGFVQSVLAGDADKAEQQMREHLARVRDDLVQLVKRLVLPFSSSGF